MGKKIRSCIFISGRGTNLRSIIDHSKNKNFPINVALVISNNIKAKGLNYAKKNNIPFKFYNSSNQISFEKNCLLELKRKKIKFICLAGFMKMLSSNFIKKFKHKIVNIHPSLLPKFKGLNTHKRVLAKREKYTGCTVHFVTSKLDSGKIILQKKIVVKKNETEGSLKKRVLKQENQLYPKAIKLLFS